MTARCPAPLVSGPTARDVMHVLEGADPSAVAGVAAVCAQWSLPRAAAVAAVRAAVTDPRFRRSEVAARYRRLLRIADRRLGHPAYQPSTLVRTGRGWVESAPHALCEHVDRVVETYGGVR